MNRRELFIGAAAGAFLVPTTFVQSPRAATPRDSIRVLAEGGPNSQDPHGAGVSSPSLGTFTNIYDRLINFDRTEISPGVFKYDYARFTGELAERFDVADSGKTLIFHLRSGATFHDGRPVTAADVKWSLDRAVSLPASKRQLSTGSLTDPAQFVVVDAQTFRIDLPRPDRYTLPNLALPFASVLNSNLVKQHATEADPWGTEWMRGNAAGGGAYRIEAWDGQRVTYSRFDGWKSGPLPKIARAVFEVVPTAANRVAALTKSGADIVLQLPPKDISSIAANPAARVISVPVTNTFRFLAFNTRAAPFNDVRVRQAIANALPFEDLFQAAVYGHGARLFGAPSPEPATSAFPQAYPYATHLDRAAALLGEAGLGKGFKTTFSYNVADTTIAEPIALLVQEALAKIGITVEIEKVTAADWGTRLTARQVPFYVESSSAWFNDPDYFFRIFFEGDWRWNFGNFDNADLGKLVDAARWETDRAVYDGLIKQAIAIAFREVPVLPLWQPTFEVGLAPGLTNFTYYIHGQVDFRPLQWS